MRETAGCYLFKSCIRENGSFFYIVLVCFTTDSNQSDNIVFVDATWSVLGDLGNEDFEPMFVSCPVSHGQPVPDLVSLAYHNVEPTAWFAPRRVHWNVRKLVGSVGLCVAPSTDTVVDARAIAEFVAYYVAAGVAHFSFYIRSATNPVLDFLLNLQRRHNMSVSFRIWRGFPDGYTTSAGDGAFVNDCTYRFMMTPIEYVLTVGLNEFVTFRTVLTFQELLAPLKKKDPTALVFLSYPFYGRGANATEMTTQKNVLRRATVDPPGGTSRVMVKAHMVLEAGCHVSHSLFRSERHLYEPEEASVNRYAFGENTDPGSDIENVELDTGMRRYQTKMETSVAWVQWLRQVPQRRART